MVNGRQPTLSDDTGRQCLPVLAALATLSFDVVSNEVLAEDAPVHPYEHLRDADCEIIWDVLWADLLVGRDDAAAGLASAIVFGNLRPPRIAYDASLYWRDAAFFAMQANVIPDQFDRGLLAIRQSIFPEYIEFIAQRRSRLFAHCYSSDTIDENCVELALEFGILSPVEDFAREIAAAEQAGARAYCIEGNPR